MLREGDVDFAVGPMLDTPADIVFYPLVTYEAVLITQREHPLANKRRVALKDVAKYPLILPPKSLTTHRFVESVFAEHQLEYDVKLEVGGYDVIKRYVELGMGNSIVMSHCLAASDRLHVVSLRRYFPPRTYGVVLRKGKQLSPAANEFVNTLCSDAQKSVNGAKRTRRGKPGEHALP
jgi:DNA-binding transcriptional LysR family regulator